MTMPNDRDVWITANGLNKSLKQAILDGDLTGGGGGGGGGGVEVFNSTVFNVSGQTSITALAYFKAPRNMTVTKVVLQIFEKGSITTGNLEIDLKKNTTPDNVGMASIFTTKPLVNFATAVNFQTNSGALNSPVASLNDGEWLRIDVTQIPAALTRFYIQVFGE